MKSALLALSVIAALALPAFAEEKVITVGDFQFNVAAPWTESQNAGMMTAAVLSQPVEGGNPLEAKFYHFGSGQGGDVEANVNRWIRQFDGSPEIKREELDFSGTKVTLLTLTGTYLDGPPMGGTKTPRPDYSMLGAILVGKDAPVFIKLTGPKAATTAALDSFKKLATSPFSK